MANTKRKRKSRRSDLFFSSLSSHKRTRKILTPPLLQLQNLKLMSWVDVAIPSYLWACLLSANIDRIKRLDLFKIVAENLIKASPSNPNVYLCHQWLGKNEFDFFNRVFSFIKNDDEAKRVLSPLCFFKNMPDYDKWMSLGLEVNNDSSLYLVNAVSKCYDHQSIEATDVRWFFVFYNIISGKIILNNDHKEFAKEVYYYPNRGDQKSVRPLIRAMEGAIRQELLEFDNSLEISWTHYFWKECMNNSNCIVNSMESPTIENHEQAIVQALKINELLGMHYLRNTDESSNNTRVEVCFGIMFDCLETFINTISSPFLCVTKDGLLLLRHISESYITLNYLVKKNDDLLFKQFQNYGNGKLKLAFLKYDSKDIIPRFIDLPEIEKSITEEKSPDLQEINLATWSGITIRKMSEDSDLKEYYDTHYEYLSEFVHCSWAGIRSSVINNCCNPLHRYHRIPAHKPRFFSGIAYEMTLVINAMLDIINSIYPPFMERVSVNPK